VSKHPIALPKPILIESVVLKKLALTVLLLVLLAVTGCSGRPAPVAERVEPSATSVLTSLPVAKAPTPTSVPATPTARKPTATFVPLITPSPTPEGGAPSKVRVPRISVGTAREMADAGEAILVDVRTKGTFEAVHIAGAISLPSEEIPERIDELPTDKLIIFYCA
jgi:hypothetical protein